MTTRSQKQVTNVTDTSATVLDEAKSLIDKITALVGSLPAITVNDKQRSSKLRKGGETVIPTVAALATQFGLTVPGHPTATMLAQLNQAQDLIPLHKQMVTALKKVEDAIFLGHSQSWASATVHYSMLRRLAKKDGDLEKALAPASQFFARKSPAVVQAEDAKRGGKKGSKAAKAAKAAQVAAAAEAHPQVSPEAVPATAPATPLPAAPSPAPINPPHS
jgi:hypothetical protein